MENPRTPVEAFLSLHGQTQRDAATGSGLGLSLINDLVKGARNPRTDTVNRFLDYCRRLDPAVTYEQLFGEAEPAAAESAS